MPSNTPPSWILNRKTIDSNSHGHELPTEAIEWDPCYIRSLRVLRETGNPG
jgi:hypothetical protein